MKVMKVTTISVCVGLFAASVACGEDLPGSAIQPERDEPLALPEQSPICLNQLPFPVAGATQQVGLIIVNRGEQTLEVGGARIADQTNAGAFDNVRIQDIDKVPCSNEVPCQVPFAERVTIAVDFTPPARGWDVGLLSVTTNDPDNQDLRVAIISAAKEPKDPDAFDPGPRPPGIECSCIFPVPDECQNN